MPPRTSPSHASGGEESLIVVAWLHLAITISGHRAPGKFDVFCQLARRRSSSWLVMADLFAISKRILLLVCSGKLPLVKEAAVCNTKE